MKKTDLEMLKAKKLMGKMQQAGAPGRFGPATAALPDRREQRRLDQAAGLVPFAVKLDQTLIKQVQDLAVERGISLNELVAALLKKGLAD